MFFETSDFEFTARLERGWHDVRGEFDALRGEGFIPWHETWLYGQGWDVFGFYAFGERLDENCDRCPETADLLDRIPGLTTAGFSVMAPGARIQPHVGYTSEVLRCHLGVSVPASCGLRVGDTTREWSEGKTLVFDDTVEHEAWNDSSEPRCVLLIDFLRPKGLATDASDEPALSFLRGLLDADEDQR